jgi:hypothetical protein
LIEKRAKLTPWCEVKIKIQAGGKANNCYRK